jgi:hypothetical protein
MKPQPETPGDHPTACNERRRAVRYAFILTAIDVSGQKTAFVPAITPGWPIRITNISSHGIGLHAGDRLDEGTLLTIKFYGRNGRPSATRQVRVVHATQQADGTWIAGAAFIEPIAESELQRMLDDHGADNE